MELAGYLRALRKRWYLLILGAVVGLGASVAATAQMPRIYQTSMQFQFVDASGANLDPVVAQQVASGRAPTYAALAHSQPVLNLVKAAMEPKVPLGHLKISATLEPQTVFFDLTISGDSQTGVYALAQAFGKAFPTYLSTQFEAAGGGPQGSNVGLKVFQPPLPPGAPISPHPKRNDAFGLALGLVLGLAGALFAEGLDRSVRGVEEVERLTRLTVLATVPVEYRGQHSVTARLPRSQRAEAIRQLRTNVQFAGVDRPLRTLLITSATSGEGKTTTAANLAITWAVAGQRVLLIDADLRRPGVATEMGLEGAVGLTSVLVGEMSLKAAVQPWGRDGNLDVLTSGPIPANPSELLGSQRMLKLLDEATGRYEMIIFDSPPLLPVTDASVLARALEGVVLVVKVGSTARDRVRRAVEILRRLDVRIVGITCNWTQPVGDYYLAGVAPRRRRLFGRRKQRRAAAGMDVS